MAESPERDHGGNLDAAIRRFGGTRETWLDLSTGINPHPYPLPAIPPSAWADLPDKGAAERLIKAARRCWNVPSSAAILAVPGASAAIAHLPLLASPASVNIPAPTYNEHAASFATAGWQVQGAPGEAQASVLVHPNNPDGRTWRSEDMTGALRVVDESFCDVSPDLSLINEATNPGTLILKSFGKFWGLAGLRLGFVIGDPALLNRLRDMLGPWPVAGIALHVGAVALEDQEWAQETRNCLKQGAEKLDQLMTRAGASLVGGTTLFRLYDVEDAAPWQGRLAEQHIWSRVFPYNKRWLRLGLPPDEGWARLESALA